MRPVRSGGWCAVAVATIVVLGCGSDDDQTSDRQDDVAVVGAPAASSSVAASSVAASSVAATTSAVPADSAPVDDLLVLDHDGLGIVEFGDPADEAVAAVAAMLGQPVADTGWVVPLTIGACAGTEARTVSWGSLHLYSSDESGFASGARHLFGYSYGSVEDLEATPAGLATPEGIGLGTTVDFLRAAYEGVVVEAGEEGIIAPSFYVDDRLSGRLTGDADDDLVTVIIGGDPCGVGM
jgi:hypothetical protein